MTNFFFIVQNNFFVYILFIFLYFFQDLGINVMEGFDFDVGGCFALSYDPNLRLISYLKELKEHSWNLSCFISKTSDVFFCWLAT